jgi:hypothetical protein
MSPLELSAAKSRKVDLCMIGKLLLKKRFLKFLLCGANVSETSSSFTY